MNKHLDCGIVRDLLPSYVDGLTNDVSNMAIEEHLEACADCARALALMREPEPPAAAAAPEVDYLKKVRRRSTRRSLLLAIVLMLLAMALLGFRFFYIGSAAAADECACHVTVDGNTVTVGGMLTGSGLGVARVVFSDSNGMVQFKVYTAPKAFFNSGDFSAVYTTPVPVTQVRNDDIIIWQDGVAINSTAARLLAAANPYSGDMPANNRIAAILGVSEQFGPYTNELQTEAEPYGWSLLLELPVAADEEQAARAIMAADSYVMLAMIENLGYVSWLYHTTDGAREYTVSADEASAYAGRDIKLYADDPAALQELLSELSIKWSGVGDVLQEQGQFRLLIGNNCGDKIYAVSIDYYLDGRLLGSSGMANADGSALRSGEIIEFAFTPEDFPAATSAISLYDFSFDLSVHDAEGRQRTVVKGVPLAAKYAWSYFHTLSGDYQGGFVLNEG